MSQFILILGIITLILDWYVFQGLKRLTANWRSQRVRKIIYRAYWVFFIGFIIGFGFAIYFRFSADRSTPLIQWFINAFLTFFVTKIVFTLVLFAEDIFRSGAAVVPFFRRKDKKGKQKEPLFPERRKFMSQLALGLASIPFFSFIYGTVKGKYDYTVHRHTLYFDDLPEAFDGFTITQVSDVHSGSFDNAAAVQRGIELIKAQQSDMFVFTGDLVNDYASEIVPYMDGFGQIRAPYGQYAVLGNHDYGMYAEWDSEAAQEANLERLKQHHAAMGYRLLLDEHVLVEKDGQKLALVGVENWGRGFIQKGDLDKALTGVEEDAFKVLLSHDPSHWDEVVKTHPSHVHLTLSGHTHGMQFGVETPLVRWSPVQYRYENWAGLAKDNQRLLYVNRGFGFIGFSGRVGIWPEVTVLELRKGKV
ncbi:metallophosphoesterase [Pontibacter diazotrophicus]|uniref:Metallophosphoesterase n=1 Tax=Pontibacter diazotrophicus TaxID=1400979 RepID=A0A3D8LHJ2_9BACT|nr:metallophosphoesterase [Pontibacter diazotrophicus]RDV16900.1 metallophosphoesterase [Pontibacter diazotrophicus]